MKRPMELTKTLIADSARTPSSVFSFNWLPGCPLLNAMAMDNLNIIRQLSLLSSAQSSDIHPNLVLEYSITEYTFDENLKSGSRMESKPLSDSNLNTLALKGRWVISQEVFVRALTLYGPNVSEVKVVSLHQMPPAEHPSWNATWPIRAILRAD